jgi:hypothetical protein
MNELTIREKHSTELISEIEQLKNRKGLITPQSIVEHARNKNSPLHKYFCWDDNEAAERYRLIQAQVLIRACVTYLPESGKIPIRAFVSLRDDRQEEGGYRSIVDILSNKEYNTKMLQDALFELHVFQEKYRRLQELSPVFAAIDKLNKPKKK